MLTDLEKDTIREHYRNIAKNMSQFRPRQAQKEMIAAIARIFSQAPSFEQVQKEMTEAIACVFSQIPNCEEDGTVTEREGESIIVIEGPTGVGKSLSYLLAGSILAKARGKQLIVSSATIALQEQLFNRDLPFLMEKSGLNLTFALAKGRGRYLCPYKLNQVIPSNGQQILIKDNLRKIADEFSERRFNGDRDTWPETIDDNIWTKVNSDEGCLKEDCPNYSECPFYIACGKLENVDVVVINHDLLMIDIKMGGGVILPKPPQDSFYCIDEAHHLVEKALNQFAAKHSCNRTLEMLGKLPGIIEKVALSIDKTEQVGLIDEDNNELAQNLEEWQRYLSKVSDLRLSENGESIWLWQDGKIPPNLELLVSNTHKAACCLYQHIDKLKDEFANKSRNDEQNKLYSLVLFYHAQIERIAETWSLLAEEIPEGSEPLAKWISCIYDKEDNKYEKDYIFHASPISVADNLTSHLWQRAAGALLTSATLQSLGNFDLLLQQTGLTRLPKTSTLALQSPFDFEAQGELYIPPIQVSPQDAVAHTDAVIEWLPKLICTKEAVGTLVLFSSRRQMQEVARRLPADYLPLLLVQNELPKAVLLQKHHQAIADGCASIIFGLDSFAEGLDLPGVACVQVIIAKLPFSAFGNPIEKTQRRWIQRQGGYPFMEITLPKAGIKLVQAVGRLIRTETDYGRITILDNRIKTRGYGKQLLAGLPPFKEIGFRK